MKSIKEKELLVNLAKSFGQSVDPDLLSEVEQHRKFENNIRESIRSNIFEDLSKALVELKQEADRISVENNFPLPPSLDDLENIILEEENDLVQTQHEETTSKTTTNTLSELAAEAITASTKRDSFQQPDPLLVAPDINSIQKKIRFLEQWIAKVSQAGPGGGETKLRFLDDVDRDSIVNGYVLSYNELTSKFTFVSPTAGSFIPTDVTQVFAEVKNAESFAITIGQPVYLYQAVGNRASVKLAYNAGDPTSAKTLGLVYSSSISPGGTGFVITQGVVTGVNTQAYNEGDTLYLGNTAGSLTAVKPYAPNHLVYIGVVERANQGQGQIYVKPQNGYELNEIHDVSINHTVPLSNNDIIVRDFASNLWINRPISYLTQTTANIIENTNLYYTNARVYANVIGLLNVKANISDLPNANVFSAATLTTARNINGVSFNGSADITVSSLVNGSDTLSLNGSNKVDLPGGTAYIFSALNNITLSPDISGSNYLEIINNVGATISTDRSFEIRTNSDGTDKVWTFTQGGSFFFPDSTYQTTAFTGTAIDSNARVTANAAYNQANVATTNAANAYNQANAAYNQANTATTIAQAAFNKANTAITTSGGQTISGNLTANSATAFIAGSAAESGVALEIPREGGIRNMYNGDNTMYFDVSNGGTTHGHFSFRGSNAFTQYAKIDNSGIDAITSYKGKSSFNIALDTEVTVDNLKFRVSNQGGVFPQVGNASGSNVDLCWSAIAVVSGGSVSAQNSGVIISAGSWSSIYTAHGLDTRGDTIIAHITDKNSGKIYRVTYLVTNNSSNTTGYNILVERII